jgi:glycosyltransferase involved in cell wall biosynthesis
MDNTESKRWLILSHAFNMDGRAASQTITDKIPHLLASGIEPIVISAITGKKDQVIEHHQVLPAGPVALRFDLRHYFKQRFKSPVTYRLLMLFASVLLLPFYIVEKLFVRIETHWSWAISAYFFGARIIRQTGPKLIYSTGGAYSAHLAGFWLSRKFGLPWIAEIHDPMVYPGQTKNRMRIKFSAWLEGIICKHADAVWWFTEEVLARAKARHPELGERGHCIIPGADAPPIVRAPYQRGAHLVIGHFGSLAETRNLEIFLQGLRQVLESNPAWAEDFRVHIYGSNIDAISRDAVTRFPWPEIVERFGRLEEDPKTGESGREQVLRRMNAMDCLLLLHGTIPFCEEYIPSKTYEYLWTQRPIFALVWNNSQMENMLRSLGHWAINAKSPEMVAKTLAEIHARWESDDLQDSGIPSPYTAEAATRRIICLAEEASHHC